MPKIKLRFVTYLAPNMFPVYQFITTYVGQKLGCSTKLSIGSSFDKFAAGEVDVGFICGLPYVQLTRQQPAPVELLAAPVLQGERYQGRPIYFSDVIVRSDSPFQTFADLRGCCWSYNDLGSHSGYNITRYRLVQLGEIGGFFGRVVAAGAHQNSIQWICSGKIDASAIDSQVLAIELRDHPELTAQIRVIDTLGPASIQPVVAAPQLPGRLKEEIRAVLLEMEHDPIAKEGLAPGFVERFAPVTDSTYDDIRAMLAAAEAIGFTTIR